jgi:hypothetical protein
MKVKYVTVCIIISALLLTPLAEALAWRHGRSVTPYGDFCPRCSSYGKCKYTMSHDDAKKAMLDYYNKKGLAVEIEQKRGRFIRAKIKDEDKVVDVIIFDRRTGRIRSIF